MQEFRRHKLGPADMTTAALSVVAFMRTVPPWSARAGAGAAGQTRRTTLAEGSFCQARLTHYVWLLRRMSRRAGRQVRL